MEIFIHDVPSHVTEKQTVNFLRPHLARFDIRIFRVNLIKRPRPCANIIILDASQGQRFLAKHGRPKFQRQPVERITWGSMSLRFYVGRTSNDQEQILRELRFEASEAASQAQQHHEKRITDGGKVRTRFDITSVQCGYWTYEDDQCIYAQDFRANYLGQLAIGMNKAMVALRTPSLKRLDFPYICCEHIIFGTYSNPYVTITNLQPPRMYELTVETDILHDILEQYEIFSRFAAMTVGEVENNRVSNPSQRVTDKDRILGIDPAHERVAGLCMVYSFRLSKGEDLDKVRKLFKRHATMPSTAALSLRTIKPSRKWHDGLFLMSTTYLKDTALYGQLPFRLRFQLESFARNARLPPDVVINMLGGISTLCNEYADEAIIRALLRLNRELPYPGPFTEAIHFKPTHLLQRIKDFITSERSSYLNPYDIARKHQHIVLVHKVLITPTGCLLQGPHAEPANRVLRRFADWSDHFVRVTFVDEDGSALGHDPMSRQDKVYIGRYKQVLDTVITIAGQSFSFLGFSHSSLRAHTCWFMAPFIIESQLYHPEHIIKLLGEFDDIRIPAKCAARIGQNFTDTNSTIEIECHMLGHLAMVTRNNRDFSDGVGTISAALLQEIHQVYALRNALKPNLLQIRFQGAKGMVSLDTRLPGKRLMLRKNMVKFEATSTWQLEVCGAAFHPLPMVLNRDLIKLLEDLGIPDQSFFNLQNAAINKLQQMTDSAINTVTLLQDHHGLKYSRMVNLIAEASDIGLQYHCDDFLTRIVSLGVVNMLQEIKYRGRIPVSKGFTLYGIMDETGYLQEGEVFIATEQSLGGRQVHVQPRVLVSRSPARHPGDAQIVSAIEVPTSSPLRALSNCIVFSQHGDRDLPSQLSGGDLDGDQYHIIFDESLIPKNFAVPADYPRVQAAELPRPVTSKDMSDFFVQFYMQDVLGMICNIHTHLADRMDTGTRHPDCIALAEMASTAVDFSKTGIPVNVDRVRSYSRKIKGGKPHFMAPSPRVVIDDDVSVSMDYDIDEPEDDAFEGLDQDSRRRRYYRSTKILGKLFDAVDEKQFLTDMHHKHSSRSRSTRSKGSSMPEQILRYMDHHSEQYGVIYSHHESLALAIKDSYEDSLFELLNCYGPTPYTTLTEAEAFSGHVLGRRSGPQAKSLRDSSKEMRERLQNIVDHTILRIKHGDQTVKNTNDLEALLEDEHAGDRELEGLPRAIATLQAAVTIPAVYDYKHVELKSFAYVAASVCLEEFRRYQITTFGRYMLPMIGEGYSEAEQSRGPVTMGAARV